MKRRGLTAEEQALWRILTAKVRAASAPEDTPPAPPSIPAPARNSAAGPPPVAAQPVAATPPLAVGDLSGLDARNARRLRRGEAPPDAVLDLHGCTLEEAHLQLIRFIETQHRREARYLLVITGKGRPGQPGVIRAQLPLWLAAPDMRQRVVAVAEAARKDGGGGAFYVRLRRKRPG